ncbi:MAG: HD domain-containing protein [Desulfovibrio sp.]|nr:HD domain-containing protein [Desulfovibrio sp.]
MSGGVFGNACHAASQSVNTQTMNLDIRSHERWFANYAAQERAKEREDPAPLDLKFTHTHNVLANARHIVSSENFTQARACLLAALYHDVARFEQYLRYRTFRDRVSCDHGLLGIKILKQERPLNEEHPLVRRLVLAAVGLHNRFRLPSLPEDLALVTRVVRDADKLDILRVMDEHLSQPGPYSPTVVMSLPDDDTIVSEPILQAALEGCVAAYEDLRSVNDFRVLLGTWFTDMNFTGSRQKFVTDGHARRILQALPANAPYAPVKDNLLKQLDEFTAIFCPEAH